MQIIMIIIAVIMVMFPNTTRTDTGTIIQVSDKGTMIWTSDLNVWEVTDKIGEKGDECIVTFNTKGSETVYDDEILSIEIK